MKIPLHLNPSDYSPETCMERYDLHCALMALNPNGWRKAGKRRGVTKKPNKKNRLRELAEMAMRKPAA